MELSRLRVLFYFAAFLLGLSVCYLYAENAPAAAIGVPAASHCDVAASTAAASPTHLLLWASPQHASFLSPISGMHLSTGAVSGNAHAAVASAAVLSEVEMVSHSRRRLLRIGHARSRSIAKSHTMNDSAVLDILSNRQLQRADSQVIQAQ